MELDTLPPDLRLNLREAFDRLADLLDEETEKLPQANAEELALYAEAKRSLFEQLAILLREANDPARAAAAPEPVTATAAEDAAADTDEEGEAEVSEPDPADPECVRTAARRLKDRVEANRRGLLAAQDAIAAVARHVGRAVEQQQTDGVYARGGSVPRRGQAGFGRVEHEL